MKHYRIIKRMKAMNWKDKKVLITGEGEFIGSHLEKKLLDLSAMWEVNST